MSRKARWSIGWIAVATALVACGGGDGGGNGGTIPFTTQMVQGKTFYREALAQEKMLITFASSGTGVTLWSDLGLGAVAEIPATWSIDSKSRLVLQASLGTITITGVAETATYLDVTADDGTGPDPARLFKIIAFGASVPDRFAVADRDLAGAAQTVGVVALASGTPGTAVFTDGFNEDGGTTWTQAADGSLALASATEDNVLFLRADSVTTSPKTLRVVGRRHDAGTTTFLGIVDSILTETPAKSGFTAGMVEGQVFFRDNTPVSRSVIRYAAGGGREEWYEDSVPSASHRTGTWTLTPLSGSLVAQPATGIPEVAAMLVQDAPARWDLLVNNGTGIYPASLQKTVAATASQWFTYTWSVTQHALAGNNIGPYSIFIGNGTGTDGAGQPFTWAVQGDGSILVIWQNGDALTIFQLEGGAPPTRFETAGIWAAGGSYTSLLVQTFAR